ncbi:response regulator [Colidextribacter sp. OB.20]|uniref:response regulator n=1 Tax=Colidextribacter sp. OB.20 TaxID=2304568 RepID=UPI00136DC141|nr:response regulator [Colidextribacter sp. OB.20]NBI10053.1 response regulator [Colidextribacter sp. OB.20]
MRNSLLIIDDSELDRAIFNEIFKKDYRVLRAATAYEGLDQVRKNVMDLAVVVLDICLQRGPSGFSVLERIHKLEGCSKIPVILLTAEPEPQWVYRGVEMGAVDFLVKPLAPIATQTRIKAIIEQHWGTEEEQDADTPPGKISLQQAELLTQRWQKKFLSFCQNHDTAFPSYIQRLRIITSALSNAYSELFPESGLLPYDAKLISMAAGFAEVGQLGLPDEIVWAGPDQPEPGRTQFFLHTKLGGEFFKGGPDEWEPLMTYCSEVATYHHKNYDGTSFPSGLARDEIPLSAQLVHTAMVCSDLADRYENEPDVFKMVYRALSLRVGRTLSPNMLKAVDASRKPLENVFRTMHLQKRVEDVEKKMQVREALTVRQDPKDQPDKSAGKNSLFYSRRKRS